MRNKKIIIIPVLLLIYVGIALLITNLFGSSHYIIFSDGVAWQFTNKWKEISFDSVKNVDLSNINLYNNQGLIEKSTLKYNKNKWLKKENNNWLEYNSEFYAVKNVSSFKLINYDKESITLFDLSNINKVLSQNNLLNINSTDELYYGYKVEKDIDNDEKTEIIYSITNMDTEISANEYYSILFIIDDNNCETLLIDKLDTIESLDNILDNNIYSIVDLNGDKIYELIARKSHYAFSEKSKYYLFEYKNNKYSLVNSD